MKERFHCIGALAVVSALSACGGRDEATDNVVAANDVNATTNLAGLANNEVALPTPAAPAVKEKAPVAKASPAKPGPVPAPAKPKPAEPAGETADPSCTPEHRAAGHC